VYAIYVYLTPQKARHAGTRNEEGLAQCFEGARKRHLAVAEVGDEMSRWQDRAATPHFLIRSQSGLFDVVVGVDRGVIAKLQLA